MAKQKIQPWKVLKRVPVLRTPWFAITKSRCKTPDGHIIKEYYVHEDRDSVMCCARDKQGRFLVEEQYRFPIKRVAMDYPSGALEKGERNLKRAALRELHEETGYNAKKVTYLFSIDKNPGFTSSRMHIFWAENLEQVDKSVDRPKERIFFKFMTPKQIFDAVKRGKLSCANCVAATYYLARRFRW